MIYGYARVSTLLQKIDRQVDELIRYGIQEKDIYIDQVSGKTFERENYKKLVKKLKKEDLLVIKSLDRLGRNYDMIIEEWKKLTITKGINILVLDMPILDTRGKENGLIGKFITDIVLQVLSFVAETERVNISQRTKEGLFVAKLKGKKLGRPTKCLPKNSDEIFNLYINKKLTAFEAYTFLKISRGTFYKHLKNYQIKY
ncbi:MAG: recombinase family protein [Roseburia sp.]|nr:recombinase family protein [Anaeroplasma bactoclasticum]MCM1196043.1 recombinase family protein [Roseburia sp.]